MANEKSYFYQKTLPSNSVKIMGNPYKGITYIQSVSVDPIINLPKEQIAVFVEEQEIIKLLEGVLGKEQGEWVISDYDGEWTFKSSEVGNTILTSKEEVRKQALKVV